jgi:predicted ester cyclase
METDPAPTVKPRRVVQRFTRHNEELEETLLTPEMRGLCTQIERLVAEKNKMIATGEFSFTNSCIDKSMDLPE